MMLAFDCVCFSEFVRGFSHGVRGNGVTSVQRLEGTSIWVEV